MSLVHFTSWMSLLCLYNQIRQEQIVAEQERVQRHTTEQIVHVPVPHIQEQIVKSSPVFSQELFPEQFRGADRGHSCSSECGRDSGSDVVLTCRCPLQRLLL